MNYSIFKTIMKLMSRQLVLHLLIPLIGGVGFEILVSWLIAMYRGLPFHLSEHLLSPQVAILYGGILITYLAIAALYVHREAKEPWEQSETKKLDRTLEHATSFFATCTIPLKDWFEPHMQQYFSQIVKRQLAYKDFKQERVLLFFHENQLADAKVQYLDGLYAKPLAAIHQNYGIDLGYLRPDEVEPILGESECPTCDFAFVTRDNEPLETVLLFEKEGHLVKLKKLVKPEDIKPYKNLMFAIKHQASEPGTSEGLLQLDEDHDFCAAVTPA